jgi:hypothetical protein
MFKYYLSFPEHVALPWNLVKILISGIERQVGVAKEKNSECGPERGVSKRGARSKVSGILLQRSAGIIFRG